jgi:hypothetical protein
VIALPLIDKRGELVAVVLKLICAFSVPAALGLKLAVAVTVPAGARLTGKDRPVRVKSALFELVADIEMEEFPEFVRFTNWDAVLPTTTLANDTDEGETSSVRVGVLVPEPLRFTGAGVLPALETIVTVPVNVPVEVGAKTIGTDVDRPAGIDNGKLPGVTEKPVPTILACETDKLDPPVFVSVSDWVALEPWTTVPNDNWDGETEIWGIPVAVMPVPLTARFVGEFVALLKIDMVTETDPVVAGVKVIGTLTLPLAGIVNGNGTGTLNPADVVTYATDTSEVPEFDKTVESWDVAPSATLPKDKLVGFAFNIPVPTVFGNGGGVVIVTLAEADCVVSAAEVAMTITVFGLGALPGAV